MNTKLLAVGGVLALVFAGVAGAFVTGFGPVPSSSGSDIESFPTETPTETPTEDGTVATAAATTTTAPPPFAFSIETIEECGRTCRDVTSTLTNQQGTTAQNITVYTRIYAGNGTDSDVVWEGSEPVGTLGSDESYTATRRVELSYSDGIAIEQNDGWVTVQTTIQTADQTVTFTEQRQVT